MQIFSDICQVGAKSTHFYFTQLNQITENKSYIPLTGCVLDHILGSTDLTPLEKLFYITADALSLVNANSGKRRGIALPSHKWAPQLGCSRSQVFKLQQSLSEKGYFIIIKDKNKSGQNKRNFIIPTLPCGTFNLLFKSTDRAGQHLPYNFNEECKRSYLDRTKLFIKLNYQILKIITSSEYLSPFHKMVWLDLFAKCYKYHILRNKEGNELSLTVSYQELLSRYSCDKRYLSKTMGVLEEVGFIVRERFYIKGKKFCQDRQDKSLWQITLSLPSDYAKEFLKLEDRSILELSSNLVHQSFVNVNASAITGGLGLTKNNVDLRAGGITTLNETNLPEIRNQQAYKKPIDDTLFRLDRLSSISSAIVQYDKSIITTENTVVSYDHDVADFRPLLNKDFKTNKYIKNIDNLDSKSVFFKRSEFYKNNFEEKATEDKNGKRTKIRPQEISQLNQKDQNLQNTKFIKAQLQNSSLKLTTESNSAIKVFLPKPLKSWHPLSKEQVFQLNSSSGREFSLNFANELLLKLSNKYPDRVFAFKNQFMSYMTKAFLNEKHQGPMVNHDTFRFVSNGEEGKQEREKQKYLSEVEYNIDTSYISQLRRKIAVRFEADLAYLLLTKCKFNHFPNENLFKVDFAPRIILTECHLEALTNEIKSVYGEVEIAHTKLEDLYNLKESKIRTGQGVSSSPYNKASDRLDSEIYLSELDHQSAWYKIRQKLKNHFGSGIDRSWFSKLTSEEEEKDSGKILLKAPTPFIRDWINNNYGLMIAQYCKIVTGLELDKIITNELPEAV